MHVRFLTARRRFAAVLDVDTVSVVGLRSVVVGDGIESCGGEVALVEETGVLFVAFVAEG